MILPWNKILEMHKLLLNENNVTKVAEICAWCDADKSVTKSYAQKGWRTSHGICDHHKDEILKECIDYYEKNGFGISSDSTPNINGM